jgi:hypothetical protein
MRQVTLYAAALALLAGPAFAQTSATTPSAGSTEAKQQPGVPSQTGGTASRVATPQQVRSTLEKAGFKEVRVLDAAYAIHAKTQDGNVVFMMVNPPDPTGATGASASATGSSTNTGSSGTSESRSAPQQK